MSDIQEENIIPELLYKDYVSFNILGDELRLICNQTEYGRSTVAEYKNQYYYLGDEPADLESALFIWQDMSNAILTEEEFEEILITNK